MAYSGFHEMEELERFLDQPWCRADLAYIDKLTALLSLRALAETQ
jgi:hypothetical protein